MESARRKEGESAVRWGPVRCIVNVPVGPGTDRAVGVVGFVRAMRKDVRGIGMAVPTPRVGG